MSTLGSLNNAAKTEDVGVDMDDLTVHHDAVVICDKRVRMKFDTESYPPGGTPGGA